MNIKFLNVVLALLLSTCLLSQANANLIVSDPYFIVGDNYTDSDNIEWEYLGFFDLADGPAKSATPTPSNGLEAALALFGDVGDSLQDFALSAFDMDTSASGEITGVEIGVLVSGNPSHTDVTHTAWYDTFDDTPGVHITGEAETANNAGGLTYDANGDISAYVGDRAVAEFNLNYVFKAVDVPEPSTLALFVLALFGLGVRRLKNS